MRISDRKYRLLALDIDGTLTVDRETTNLCLDVIEKLRILEKHGIMITLISSNALPVVVALRKYMGFSGPAIGETGSLVYFGGREIHHLTSRSTRDVAKDVIMKYGDYVFESWQNMFRIHDYALIVKKEHRDRAREVYMSIKEYVEEKYECVDVGYSGYAIHLTPCDVGKGKALRYVIEKLGLNRDEVVGIGDSFMDLDFLREVGLSIAVGNADEELKKNVDLVTKQPSCKGVLEFIEKLV